MRLLTVSRLAVLIKDYPKDREHRWIKLAVHVAEQLQAHIAELGLGPDDLLFTPPLLIPPPEPSQLQLATLAGWPCAFLHSILDHLAPVTSVEPTGSEK